MKRYSVRPARLSDVETVYEIIAAQNDIDFGSPLNSLDDLKKSWEGMDLDEDTCAAFADGQLAGYGELLDNNSPFIYLKERTNVDLAFQLLTILEDKALIRKKGSGNLMTRISAKNHTLSQLYASKGYKANLSFFIMEINLTEPPPVSEWPEGIKVRKFVQNQDEQGTYQADEEAAQDKGYHTSLSYDEWKKRMGMDRETFDPSIWFLACAGDEIAGIALNVFNEEMNIGWVDHLSVRSAWRKRGIGKALLLHTFGEFYRRGIHTVKLNVDSKSLTGAPRLYQSVGMETVQEYYIYRKEI